MLALDTSLDLEDVRFLVSIAKRTRAANGGGSSLDGPSFPGQNRWMPRIIALARKFSLLSRKLASW